MKKGLLLFILIFSFFVCIESPKAKSFSIDANGSVQLLASNNEQCSLLGDPTNPENTAYYLQLALDIIKYVGIALCIVLTSVEILKAIINDEKDLLKSIAKKGFTRLIFAVLLFFLPVIVNVLLTMIDVYGTCAIS